MSIPLTDNYQLKWHSFGSHLHSCVAASLTGDNFTDAILYTIDGHQLLAHRFILSACSQYFNHVLKTQAKMTSTLPLVIVMPADINYKTLKILIQYMYSGEATVSKDILENVLKGGDLLKIKGLWRPREEEKQEQKHPWKKLDQKSSRPSSNPSSVSGRSSTEPPEASTAAKGTDRSGKEPKILLKARDSREMLKPEHERRRTDVERQRPERDRSDPERPEHERKRSERENPERGGRESRERGDHEKGSRERGGHERTDHERRSHEAADERSRERADERGSRERADVKGSRERASHERADVRGSRERADERGNRERADERGNRESADGERQTYDFEQDIPAETVTHTKPPLKVYKRPGSNRKHTVSESGSESQMSISKSSIDENVTPEDNLLQFLVIKEEPLEWNEVNVEDMELVSSAEVFNKTELDIKPEIEDEQSSEHEDAEEGLYTPLTCELCSETFKLPADWVRHIQTHTDMLPAKRQRRGGGSYDEDNNGTFPPLRCDLCDKVFSTPAEWVHHIQNTHTEFELHMSNKSIPKKVSLKQPQQYANLHKFCTICNKKFPSHASMLIHRRTHTGEKPYMCQYCSKGFNVKSNLLRHLRTLHDMMVNSAEVSGTIEESG